MDLQTLTDEVILGDPLIQEISKYLPPNQLIELRKVHPYHTKIPFKNFKISIINKIHDRLKVLFED
jgi:hypothetical protein